MDFLTLNPVGLLARMFGGRPRRPMRYGMDPYREEPDEPSRPSIYEYYKDKTQILRERLECYRDMCFTKDTKISLLDGTEKSLDQLMDYPDPIWVYSYDHKTQQIVPGKASKPFKTGEKVPVLKVTLDNGESVRCTPNHRWMLRDGTYREAKDLQPNDSLMPLYRKVCVTKPCVGYEMFLEPSREKWIFTHRRVCDQVLRRAQIGDSGQLIISFGEGEVRHHLNFNKRDNRPDNLVWMDFNEHILYHSSKSGDLWNRGGEKFKKAQKEGVRRKWEDPDWASKQLELLRSLGQDPELAAKRNRILREATARNWQNPEYVELMTETGKNTLLKTRVREDFQRKVRLGQLVLWSDPDHIQRMGNLARGRITLQNQNPDFVQARLVANTTPKECDICGHISGNAGALALHKRKHHGVVPTNHKVISVVPDGEEDVYDITVENYHNFALSAGVFVHNCEMDYDDLVSSVLDAVTEDATQTDMISGRMLWISSDNQELQTLLMKFLDEMELEDKGPSIIREAAKFGDCFERVWYRRGEGVVGMEYMEPHRMSRYEEQGRLRGYTIDVPAEMHSNVELFNPWDYLHYFRAIGRLRPDSGYGDAWARPARRLWRKLQMVEDSIILYRLKMAPDRFVYYTDVGESSAAEAVEIIRMWRRALKKHVLYQPDQGKLRVDQNPLAVDSDLFWPVKEGSTSRIEKLAGSANTMGEIHDYELLVKRLFSVLRAPPSYFGMKEEGAVIDNGKSLAQQDVRWARGIKACQKSLTRGTTRLCQIHMAMLGIDPTDEDAQFEVQMAPVSYLEEQQRLEVFDLRSRAIDAISRVLTEVDGLDKKRWIGWLLWKFGGLSKGFLDQFVGGPGTQTPAPPPVGQEGTPVPGVAGEPLAQSEQESLVDILGPGFLKEVAWLAEGLDQNTRSDSMLGDLLPVPTR